MRGLACLTLRAAGARYMSAHARQPRTLGAAPFRVFRAFRGSFLVSPLKRTRACAPGAAP